MVRNKQGKIAIIAVIVVLIVVCSVAGVAVMKKKPHGGHAGNKVPEGPATMIAIGELIVNLADAGDIRYAKADIVLEVHGKVEAAGGEHGSDASKNAPLKDAIISTMSSKRFADLNRPGGKEALKTQIMRACNRRLKEAQVTNVYFNAFAMQ